MLWKLKKKNGGATKAEECVNGIGKEGCVSMKRIFVDAKSKLGWEPA